MSNVCITLVGLPASGKSTLREALIHDASLEDRNYEVVSSDDYLEKLAKINGKTYDQIWNLYNKEADKYVTQRLAELADSDMDIIVDRTNLTKKSRAKILRALPNHRHIAIIVYPNEDDFTTRHEDRKDKVIPPEVLYDMAKRFEPPTEDEGYGFVEIHNSTEKEFGYHVFQLGLRIELFKQGS